MAKIRLAAATKKDGTNLLGLQEAAKKLGFDTRSVKGNLESLSKIPLPAIVHLVLSTGLHHFVVLYEVSKKGVKVMDPGIGDFHTYSFDNFEQLWSKKMMLLLPDDSVFKKENQKISLWRRGMVLIHGQKSILVQAFVGVLIYTLLGLGIAKYVEFITDQVIPNRNFNLMTLLGVGMIILLIVRHVLSFLYSLFSLYVAQNMDMKLILGYYKYILLLPQAFFDGMRTGEIISRINYAVKVRQFLNEGLINFLLNILIVILSFMLMYI